jgi:rhomboid protease GluP
VKAIADKIRIIYVPFLLISAGFIAVYSFLNWALFMSGALSIREEITNFWLPFILSWIPVLVWLRPRIRALKLKKSKSLYGVEFVAVLATAIPTIIAQSYLETATGRLTQIDRVSQIHSSPNTKYYLIREFYADKRQTKLETLVDPGTGREPLKVSAFFASPLRDAVAEAGPLQSGVWLGIKYTAQIDRHFDRAAADEEYQKFIRTSVSKFNDENLRSFTYLEKIGNNDDRRALEAAVRKSDSIGPSKSIILMGQRESFESRNGNKLAWALGIFGSGAVAWFFMLLFPQVDEEELRRIQRGRPSPDKDLKESLHLFLPRPGFYVTPIIMVLNILVFLIMVCAGLGLMSFQTRDLLNWGANYAPLVREGQWFRLFTSVFIHGGLAHLAMNAYGLLFAGVFLEPMLGSTKFVLAYLVTGIAGSIVSIHVHPDIVSIGASGGIFGLYGVLLVLLFIKDFGRALVRDPLLINIAIFVGLNLLVGSVATGIDNAAHLGGLLSGILVGALFFPALHRKERMQANV